MSSQDRATAWIRHYNFLDPEVHGLLPYIYINLVRDPVERVISDFHYRRYKEYVM